MNIQEITTVSIVILAPIQIFTMVYLIVAVGELRRIRKALETKP